MADGNEVKTGEIVEVKGDIKPFDSFRAELSELQKNNASLVFDYQSKKGQKEARSHIFLLRKSRSALETARTDEKKASREYGQKVDAEAKAIEKVILDMIDVHLAPVEEAEQREEKRMAEIAEGIEYIGSFASSTDVFDKPYNAEQLTSNLSKLHGMEIDDKFAEFIDEAQGAKDRAIDTLTSLIATVAKAEADAVELEQLRKDAAERDEEDRLDREAKEQSERDERIREEARVEEKRKAEAREAELIAEAAKAEQEKKDAEAKAERDQAEAVRMAEEKAKSEAAQKETARLAKEETERREAEHKAAGKRHQKKINNAAVDSLVECGHSEDSAKALIVQIATGKIANVTINY